ncbi:Flp pilus assembly protein TadD [Pacificibacter maritimus]|uniref:Flp pilus assembly protein TadD n=1 Tax=Pacificibacter maritimus TaxID=762213 RepID=A0A3N4U8Y4_9RHOB|nr:tetratricopeptide repeat protein [Pacificibacter maritimus]RPE66258.1 Flp pilus assembly protein TadD [Pacificibacter maritimus]
MNQSLISKCVALGLSAMMLTSTATPSFADAGAYLATRQASLGRDYKEQAFYAQKALVNDPQNVALLETLISAKVSMGAFDEALGAAITLKSLDPDNQLAAIVLIESYAQAGEWDKLLKELDTGEGISKIIDGLTRAWVYIGKGDVTAALQEFDKFEASAEGLSFFGPYNRALALAMVGDFEGGLEILDDPDMPQLGGIIFARVHMLSQLDRNDEALVLIDEAFGPTNDPLIATLVDLMETGNPLPFTIVRSAQDGIAEVFSAVAEMLTGEMDDSYTLLYARTALSLRSDRATYAFSVANILERLGHYDLAIDVYDKIDPKSPIYYVGELGRAEAFRAQDKTEAEIEILRSLYKTHSDLPEVAVSLGDAMRRGERYKEAIEAYSTALAMTPEPTVAQWPLFFTRGIAYERSDQWDKAEADFRKALELRPAQPQVLNYMGYSFVEMNTNLDEAMSMIRAAVAARPNDGFITDSLGWGLYRLGQFEQAVAPMEKAAALLPVDPIINDHLGDVYWAVGREREAKFQWTRALSFEPEEKDAARIREKLAVGLDQVLINEGAEPTRVAIDG